MNNTDEAFFNSIFDSDRDGPPEDKVFIAALLEYDAIAKFSLKITVNELKPSRAASQPCHQLHICLTQSLQLLLLFQNQCNRHQYHLYPAQSERRGKYVLLMLLKGWTMLQ